jgi:hypothetical protein
MQPENMGMNGMSGGAWYKNKAVLGILVVIIVIGGFFLFKGGSDSMGGENTGGSSVVVDNADSIDTAPKSGEVALMGKFGCTPLKSGATPTQAECVLGLMGDDGKFYALDTSKVEQLDANVGPESGLKVVGVMTPVDANSEEAGIFKYDGVVAVRLLVENK